MKRHVSRRTFLQRAALGAGALVLGGGVRAYAAGGRRPNILFIISDDHGKRDCGCYGNDHVVTPHIDELARHGTRFDAAHAVTAVCTPSRSCMITGLYPHANGSYGFAPMKRGVKTLPSYMRAAGYKTGCIGKLHLKCGKDQVPFDVYVPRDKLGHGRDIDAYAVEVRDFFAQHKNVPFFLQVGYSDPHRPFPTPGVKKGPKAEVPDPHDPASVWVPPSLADLPAVRKELGQYYDSIRRLDRGVGLVLAELDRAGLADDTLVIYTSDHGRAFPFAKTTMYDAGLNVPFVARWPKHLPAGATCDSLIHFVDLLPTFLELAGDSAPAVLQGKSFAPVLEDVTRAHNDHVFGSHTTQFFKPWVPSRTLRERRYRYVYNFAPGIEFRSDSKAGVTWGAMSRAARKDPQLAERLRNLTYRPLEELFDTREDPYEQKNLAESTTHAPIKARMLDELKAFMKRIDDPWLPILLEQERYGYGKA